MKIIINAVIRNTHRSSGHSKSPLVIPPTPPPQPSQSHGYYTPWKPPVSS